jgi:hypothetical protein
MRIASKTLTDRSYHAEALLHRYNTHRRGPRQTCATKTVACGCPSTHSVGSLGSLSLPVSLSRAHTVQIQRKGFCQDRRQGAETWGRPSVLNSYERTLRFNQDGDAMHYNHKVLASSYSIRINIHCSLPWVLVLACLVVLAFWVFFFTVLFGKIAA